MNYLETLKNITKSKNQKKENIIFILILLVFLLFSCTYIFKDNKSSIQTMNQIDETEIQTIEEKQYTEEIEEKLSNILSQISGISDVSVALTYNNTGNDTPIFNTKETSNETQITTEKNVAYNEKNGEKTAVIASSSLPSVEGAIIVAKGAQTTQVKSKIANAVATCLGIPVYKVQVFEKE